MDLSLYLVCLAAARATPSGTPELKTGTIRVLDGTTGGFLGCLTNALNSFGEYGSLTQDKTLALTFKYDPLASNTVDLVSDVSTFVFALKWLLETDIYAL